MPRYKDGMSPRQKKFVKAYLETGNQTEAARQCYPNQTLEGVHTQGWNNMQNPAIKALIAKSLLKQDLSIERVTKVLSDELDSVEPAYRLKAAELAGKYLKMFTEKQDVTLVLDKVKSIGWSETCPHCGKDMNVDTDTMDNGIDKSNG